MVNSMATIAVIGDSHATDIGSLFSGSTIKSIGGISVNDARIKTWLESAKDFDKIYFCCSHPLCGYDSRSQLINMLNLPVEVRYSTKIKPGFLHTTWIDSIKQPTYYLLSQVWFQQIEFFLEMYPQIILIPLLASFGQVAIAGVSPDPIELLSDFPQISVGHLLPEHYRDEYGHLNALGLASLVF